MDPLAPFAPASAIAAAVRAGEVSARAVAEAALARIEAENPKLNAVSAVSAERALSEAESVDVAVVAGRDPGTLAGVPFAVKNLFDVAWLTTLAGAAITAEDPPAGRDADLVERMRAAGAVLVGALHMGEFAYDFTGENAHYGPCRNPHDLGRMTGGSSSGCGAATAAGLAPVSLGSDTNGSLRVPASLCGVFSLKPTYGRLSRGGTYPFVDSLDHLGPFARTAEDLVLAYDALQGGPSRDAAFTGRVEPVAGRLGEGVRGLRVGFARGWIESKAGEEALARRDRAALAVADDAAALVDLDLDGAEAARAAAFLITNSESAAWRLETLRRRSEDFDPDTRDRFLAGALIPAAWTLRAQRARRWWLERMLAAFREVDLILAPATPTTAPRIGDRTLSLGGRDMPLRPNLGLLATPFSCVGLPVVTVPVFEPGEAPLGLQIVAPPWREDLAMRAAAHLDRRSGFRSHPPVRMTTVRAPAAAPEAETVG